MNDPSDIVHELLKQEAALIEADIRALGITESDAGHYEIVRQESPQGQIVYRGIQKDGVFVWDRYPDWPTPEEIR